MIQAGPVAAVGYGNHSSVKQVHGDFAVQAAGQSSAIAIILGWGTEQSPSSADKEGGKRRQVHAATVPVLDKSGSCCGSWRGLQYSNELVPRL